jgi:hypothetical protein
LAEPPGNGGVEAPSLQGLLVEGLSRSAIFSVGQDWVIIGGGHWLKTRSRSESLNLGRTGGCAGGGNWAVAALRYGDSGGSVRRSVAIFV